MNISIRNSQFFLVLGVVVLLLALTATWIVAQTDGIIEACYKIGGDGEEENANIGQLRLVSSPDDCKKSESYIQWNSVGPQGPQGSPGISGYEIVRGLTVTSPDVYVAKAQCPEGKKVLGGGGAQGSFGWYLDDSAPLSDGSGWYVQYAPGPGITNGGIGEAWAVCAYVQ